MLDVPTTITVNGTEGDRFLASLDRYRAPVPRALRWLASSEYRSIQVDPTDAEEVAEFVDGLVHSGWLDTATPPLLFSPRIGDDVVLCADVLAEIVRHAPGLPPSWRFLPAATHGKLVGWRDRGGDAYAVIDVDGTERRLVVYVSEPKLTRATAPVVRRGSCRR